jgi:NAD(P)-dependent dehydrogenase (short-subunit alcohol dehydrogenase family)
MGVLDNKIAIVTGAAQGIGRAIALRFAKQGASVMALDINPDQGAETIRLINAAGAEQKAQFMRCDVSVADDVDAAVAETVRAFGGVDVLVNNAGIAIYKLLWDYTEEDWDRVIAVNLRSIFLTARRCIPIMRERGGGSIVNMASVHARATATTVTSYVASKGGIISLTRAMALECAPYKIRVNCILPGAIATPMLLENWGDAPHDRHPLVPSIALKRIAEPDEIATVAQFLASDDSSYLTGSDILADGGLSAHFSPLE